MWYHCTLPSVLAACVRVAKGDFVPWKWGWSQGRKKCTGQETINGYTLWGPKLLGVGRIFSLLHSSGPSEFLFCSLRISATERRSQNWAMRPPTEGKVSNTQQRINELNHFQTWLGPEWNGHVSGHRTAIVSVCLGFIFRTRITEIEEWV